MKIWVACEELTNDKKRLLFYTTKPSKIRITKGIVKDYYNGDTLIGWTDVANEQATFIGPADCFLCKLVPEYNETENIDVR